MSDIGLAYTGKIISIDPIEGADFIACATVVCGRGGKWRGVVRRAEVDIGLLVTVYLPDAIIPPSDEMKFMEASNWRVRMRRFKGAPSEVVIVPLKIAHGEIGFDCTELLGVTKYFKPIPANLAGKALGPFPGFIPRTDEPNYQHMEGQEAIERLCGQPFYITEKADGSSTTAYKYKGHFGVCSRNWELQPDENIGYWIIARKYKLEENLREGIALQWETCGPKIQSNPMGLKGIDGFAFSAYNIPEHRYLEFKELFELCEALEMPTCKLVAFGDDFPACHRIELLGERKYSNGKQAEGVVVRSQMNFGSKPLSFKVINLNYEK